mmetsp:Transcript_55229/g.147428  ORF Transcript_55229/g.147428 Transcript_55229/m.147428 type:complete len:495 (-) Transcript_55229:236-1720(-)
MRERRTRMQSGCYVHFRVECPSMEPEDVLAVCGSSRELGQGNPDVCPRFVRNDSPWRSTQPIWISSCTTFKFVIIGDGLKWDSVERVLPCRMGKSIPVLIATFGCPESRFDESELDQHLWLDSRPGVDELGTTSIAASVPSIDYADFAEVGVPQLSADDDIRVEEEHLVRQAQFAPEGSLVRHLLDHQLKVLSEKRAKEVHAAAQEQPPTEEMRKDLCEERRHLLRIREAEDERQRAELVFKIKSTQRRRLARQFREGVRRTLPRVAETDDEHDEEEEEYEEEVEEDEAEEKEEEVEEEEEEEGDYPDGVDVISAGDEETQCDELRQLVDTQLQRAQRWRDEGQSRCQQFEASRCLGRQSPTLERCGRHALSLRRRLAEESLRKSQEHLRLSCEEGGQDVADEASDSELDDQDLELADEVSTQDVQDVMRAGFLEEELSRRSSRASCESNESLGRRDIKGERRAAEAKLRRACEDLRLELDDVEGAGFESCDAW